MKKEDTDFVSKRITPLERERIEKYKKLTAEEMFVLKRKNMYMNFISSILFFYFVLQTPIKLLIHTLSLRSFFTSYFVFIFSMLDQTMTLLVLAGILYGYIRLIDWALGMNYFKKAKEIRKKIVGDNGIQN
jgi:hypothetical protein